MAAAPSTAPPPGSYLTPKPTAIAQGRLGIDHPQLRDLLVCRQERGLVSYLKDNSIVEQNLLAPGAPTRTVLDLPFTPSSLNAIALGPNDEDILYAAGGSWHADLHLSYHQANGSSSPIIKWQTDTKLNGTLNNSVLLTKNPGAVEPRVGVTNNDCTFRMYECGVRRNVSRDNSDDDEDSVLQCVGGMALDTCANFASISPSGRTLLSVGDSPNLYLHNIRGSSRLSFYPIATLPLPLPTNTPPHYPTTRPSTFTASFSTSFSHDSLHFAVGSQEGVAGIWDIRHASRPMKVWQVDKMRAMGVGNMGAASGAISWDPSDWFHSSAPAWSIRNVKFIGGNRSDGKEYLVFTEHTSLMHIVNAKTLEVEEIVRIPSKMADPPPPTPPMYSSDVPSSPLAYIQLGIPARLLSLGPAGGRSSQSEEEEFVDDDPDAREAGSSRGHDDEDEAGGAVSEGGSLFSPSTLLDLAFSGFSAGQSSANDAPDFISNRTTSSRARRRRGLVFPYSADRLTPPPPPDMPLPIHTGALYPSFASPSGRRTPSSVSTSSTRFRRSSRTRINKSRTCESNPEYIISDGYAFRAETAELDYRRLESEENEEDPLQLEQGLDIAGMCSDPTGRWLYVGTSRGVVEWGLV